MRRRIIAIVNQKGGSAKSHVAALVALALASLGGKVLAVDCDPQAGLTQIFRPDQEEQPGLFDVLTGYRKIKDVIAPVKRDVIALDLLPADYRLDDIAHSLDPFALQRTFQGLNRYKHIVIDNPPTVQGIARASSMIADLIIVPADVARTALGPTKFTLTRLADVKKRGKVLLVGYREPKPNETGYAANLARLFARELSAHVIGSIPRNVTMTRAVNDPAIKWTEKKIERVLKPLIGIIGA